MLIEYIDSHSMPTENRAMTTPATTNRLKKTLDRLRARNLSEMGFEAQIVHERRIQRLEGAYQRALERQAEVPKMPRELPEGTPTVDAN